MEDSVDIAIRHIQDWAKVIVYIIIGLVAIWVKAGKKRKQQQAGRFDSPEPETAPQQPQPVPARPAKKRPVAPKPAERRYFTYENDADYKSMAEQKKQTATQLVNKEEEGSATDFDLRAAVIASEILKPKFEE